MRGKLLTKLEGGSKKKNVAALSTRRQGTETWVRYFIFSAFCSCFAVVVVVVVFSCVCFLEKISKYKFQAKVSLPINPWNI